MPGVAGRTLGVASAAILAVQGSNGPAPPSQQVEPRLQIPAGLDLYLPVPPDNPIRPDIVALGASLFSDPILSRDGATSCATCHDARKAFTDGQVLSTGVYGRKGTRHVPTLINRAYGRAHFWDGRAATLEALVLKPVENPDELGMPVEDVLVRLQQDRRYARRFRSAFGRDVNREDLTRALASYVRSILSGNSPVDQYLSGKRDALSAAAREGLRIFRGKARCTACHLGSTFTDERFHNTGVAWRESRWLDLGRFNITGKDEDRGVFKTPTLREVARTAPYMHDGSIATLAEVVDFYNRGGNPNPNLDPELRPLYLRADEKQALLAFLTALGGAVQHHVPGKSP